MIATFPMWCFAYQAHFSSVKVYRRLERPKTFPYVSALALFICFIMYNITGCFCLATWGSDVDPQMLNSYALDDFPMYFARIGIIGCVSGAYPVFTIMPRDILSKSECPKFRYGFAVCWYITALVGAIYLPGFDIASKVKGHQVTSSVYSTKKYRVFQNSVHL